MTRQMRFVSPRKFLRDEAGGATVEACLWIPFFLSFFVLILDAAFIFLQETDAQRIVQDGNRQYVTGAIASTGALETWIETAMVPLSPNANATARVDGAGVLTTVLTYPAEDTDLTGATGVLGGLTMRVQSIYLTEI